MTDRRIRIIIDSRQAQRAAKNLDRGVTRVGRAADNAGFAVNRLASAIASIVAVDKIIKYADAWTEVQNQIIRTVDSQEDLIRTSAELLKVSNDTLTGIKETTAIYTSLSVSTKSLGVTQSEVIGVTKTINNLFREGGKSAAETAGAIRQLGQALESGTLRGDEFNSVAEGAPGILRAVELQTGKTRAELREFAAQGSIDAGLLVKSLQAYEKQAQEAADKTTATFSQSLIVAANNATAFVGANKLLIESVGLAGDAMVTLSENLEVLLNVIGAAAALYVARLLPSIVAVTVALAAQAVTAINQQRVIASMAGVAGQASNANRILAASAATAGRAMAFLGGPAGILFLVVAALSAYSFSSEEAGDSTDDLSDQVDVLTQSYKNLSTAQAEAQRIDVVKEIAAQESAISDLQARIDRMRITTDAGFTITLDSFDETELIKAEAAIDTATQKIEKLRERLGSLNSTISSGATGEPEEKTKKEVKNDNRVKSFTESLQAQTASLQRQLDLRSNITAIHGGLEANAEASRFDRLSAESKARENVELAENLAKEEEAKARNTLNFETKLATLVLEDEQEKALRAEFKNQDLINDQIFQQQRNAIVKQGAKDRQKIATLEAAARVSTYASMAKSGLAVLEAFGNQSFQSQKNFTIAKSIISIAGGVAQALNNPYPANLGFAASVAVQGAGLISTIRSAKPKGGGSTPRISGGAAQTPASTASSIQPEERQTTTFTVVGLKPDELISGRQLASLLEQFGEDGGKINYREN